MPPQEAPKKIRPRSLADYLEVMTQAVFQSGMSWRVIESKWEGFKEAFANFDPGAVAAFDPKDIKRLSADKRIVRNAAKINATINNAQVMLELEDEFGSFRKYLRSHGGFEETVSALRKNFKFIGDAGAYFFLYVVGEKVPGHEEWMASLGRPVE